MACMDCHSERQWDQFAAPIDKNRVGSGGQLFGHEDGIPGSFTAPNITPSHLNGWTDGELYRAITMGVSKNGRALFPVMPYLSYGKMDTEDIYSVIAYLRTLPGVVSTTPEPVADFPMNFIINTIPKEAAPQSIPSQGNTLAYGAYLVRAADCKGCHTADKGEDFSGGRPFKMPGSTTYSSNITTDLKTGIGAWTKEQFVARFKSYANLSAAQPVRIGEFQTNMPWRQFGKMTDADLIAVYTYLKSMKSVENQVVKFKPDH